MNRRSIAGRTAYLHQALTQLHPEALARRVKNMAAHMGERTISSLTGLSIEQVRRIIAAGNTSERTT